MEGVNLKDLAASLLSYLVHSDPDDGDHNSGTHDEAATAAAAATSSSISALTALLPTVSLRDSDPPTPTLRVVFDGSSGVSLLSNAPGGGILDAGRAACTASSCKGTTAHHYGPHKALLEAPFDAWHSATDEAVSWWQLTMEERLFISHVDITWRTEGASPSFRSIPESFNVSYSLDGTTWTPASDASLAQVASGSPTIRVDALCRCIRVDMRGYASVLPKPLGGAAGKEGDGSASVSSAARAKAVAAAAAAGSASKDRAHTIARFAIYAPDPTSARVSSATTRSDLELLLYRGIVGRVAVGEVAASSSALMRLCVTTASPRGLLLLVKAMLVLQSRGLLRSGDASRGDAAAPLRLRQLSPLYVATAEEAALEEGRRPSSSAASIALGTGVLGSSSNRGAATDWSTMFGGSSGGDVPRFLNRLGSSVDDELEVLLSSSTRTPQPVIQPRFDPSAKNTTIDLSEADSRASTTTSTKSYVLGTAGFSRGRALWEFKCETVGGWVGARVGERFGVLSR